jgi:hypothetical protein
VHHTGGIPGISTAIGLFPDQGLGVILLSNGDAQAGANKVVFKLIADSVLRIEDPTPWPYVDGCLLFRAFLVLILGSP